MRLTNFHFTGIFVVLNDILPRRNSFVKLFCRSEWLLILLTDMIKCHLSRLMGERKLKIADVARDTELHRNTITLLYDETAARVDLEAIDRLCQYFGITVGELLEHRAEDKKAE